VLPERTGEGRAGCFRHAERDRTPPRGPLAQGRSKSGRLTLQELGADFATAYTLDWGHEFGLLAELPQLRTCMQRTYARPNAPPRIAEAFARIGG
jgi:hypothetical protein